MTATASEPAALHVRELCKEYPAPGEPLRVLRGVSLDLSAGQSLAVLGVSGSGKSTLLNILGTLDTPTSGTVRLGELDPFTLDGPALAAFRGRRVGLVFQDHHLLPQCTARENLLLAPLAAGKVTAEDRRRADELLDRVGLASRADHLPWQLSGGERQRVAVARALMNQPALVLADEPTGNLDAAAARQVAALLLELAAAGGAILIVATHSPVLAAQAGRRVRLNEGQLVDEP